MANSDFEQNKGKITRLYPEGNKTYFTLGGAGAKTAMSPNNGYYFIPATHGNYRALVDLLYLCTVHGWVLQVRTQPALVGGHGEVVYLVVDYQR